MNTDAGIRMRSSPRLLELDLQHLHAAIASRQKLFIFEYLYTYVERESESARLRESRERGLARGTFLARFTHEERTCMKNIGGLIRRGC